MGEHNRNAFDKTGQSRTQLSLWRKQVSEIEKLPVIKQKTSNYLLLKEDDIRKTGLFSKQQKKVEDEIHSKRQKGDSVSTLWVRARMKFHCNKDKPSGYDPEKHKFTKKWCKNFMDRKDLAIRRKTNKKNLPFLKNWTKSKISTIIQSLI